MPTSYEEITAKAMELSLYERVKLAQELTYSIDGDTAEDEDVEKLWFEVAERRLAEMKSGKVKGMDADQALAMARHKLRA